LTLASTVLCTYITIKRHVFLQTFATTLGMTPGTYLRNTGSNF